MTDEHSGKAVADTFKGRTLAAIAGWMRHRGVSLPVDLYSRGTVDGQPESILAMHAQAVCEMAEDARAYRELGQSRQAGAPPQAGPPPPSEHPAPTPTGPPAQPRPREPQAEDRRTTGEYRPNWSGQR